MYSRFFKLLKYAAYATPLIGLAFMPKAYCENHFIKNKASIQNEINSMLFFNHLPFLPMENIKVDYKDVPKVRIDLIGKDLDFLALHNSALMAFNVAQFDKGCRIIRNEKVENSTGIRYTLAYSSEKYGTSEIRIYGITKKEGKAVCIEVAKLVGEGFSKLDLFLLAAIYYDAIKVDGSSFTEIYSSGQKLNRLNKQL